MPGQPMYYAVPAKARAARSSRKKFVALATSPEVQAEGIVKRFNWYPGIDAKHVQAKLDEATWNKLFTDITPEDLATKRQAVPDRAVLQRHPRSLRAEGRELTLIGSRRSSATRGSAPSVSAIVHASCASSALGFCLRPALAMVGALLRLSARLLACQRLHGRRGVWASGNFVKAFELYRSDIVFTLLIIALSTAPHRRVLDRHRRLSDARRESSLVAILRWLYRWPLFIPFIVAGQFMRTFLAKNGMMNNALVALGLIEPARPRAFSTGAASSSPSSGSRCRSSRLLVAGAMASLDRAHDRGGAQPRRLAAAHPVEIVLPQVRGQTLLSASILSFVTMLSVLSVPLMINAQRPP